MPKFGPIKHQELISCLRKLGFQGPYSGGKHQFMVRDNPLAVTVRRNWIRAGWHPPSSGGSELAP